MGPHGRGPVSPQPACLQLSHQLLCARWDPPNMRQGANSMLLCCAVLFLLFKLSEQGCCCLNLQKLHLYSCCAHDCSAIMDWDKSLHSFLTSMSGAGGKWQQAQEIFEQMKQARFKPDVSSYAALLAAYHPADKWRQALQVRFFSCPAEVYCAALCCAQDHAVLQRAMLFRAGSCCAMPCCARPCCAMLGHAAPFCPPLCYIVYLSSAQACAELLGFRAVL